MKRQVQILLTVIVGVASSMTNHAAIAQTLTTGQSVPTETTVGIPSGYDVLELPAGELERAWKYEVRFREDFLQALGKESTGWMAKRFRAGIAGPGPVELMVSIDGPTNACPLRAMVVDISEQFDFDPTAGPSSGKTYAGGPRFRRLFPTGVSTRDLAVQLHHTRSEAVLPGEESSWSDFDCELTVVLTRRFDRCVMYAEVSGDVDGTFFGDGAFFVEVEPGTPIELGVALDPGMMQLMDQLLGMATAGAEVAGDSADTSPAEGFEGKCYDGDDDCEGNKYDVPPGSFAEALKQWADEEDEEKDSMPAVTAQDRYAVNLSDVRFSDSENLGLGGFSLSTSFVDIVDPAQVDGAPVIPAPLSAVYMLPGLFDESLSGVKFVWEKGMPGNANMVFQDISSNRLIGSVSGSLRSERPYEDGYLWAEVTASFVALRGPRACQGQY